MLFFQAITLLGEAFAAVMNGLCRLVGHHAGALPARAVFLGAIHWRLARMIGRLDRLVLRWQAGTLPTPRPPRPAAPRRDRPAPPKRLPAGRHWLIRALQPTAQFGGQVAAFLARPDTREFLAAAPQAGRILRPLCRGLAVEIPDWLALPPPPPRAKPAPKPKPAPPPRAAGDPPPTPDRPIPANILAAARAWKKKFGP